MWKKMVNVELRQMIRWKHGTRFFRLTQDVELPAIPSAGSFISVCDICIEVSSVTFKAGKEAVVVVLNSAVISDDDVDEARVAAGFLAKALEKDGWHAEKLPG